MKYTMCSLLLLSSLMACDESSSKLSGNGSGITKNGSANFKSMLAQGAGAMRPKSISAAAGSGRNLSLNAASISSIKIDDGSGAWAWVGFNTTLSDSVKADQDLVKAATDFVTRYEKELGFSPGEILVNVGAVQSPYAGVKLVTLQRQFQGTLVKGAFINFFFAIQADKSLRLSEIVNNSYGPIKVGAAAAMPSDSDAIEATGISSLAVTGKRPVIQAVLGSDGRYSFAYAAEFQLESKESTEKITMTLDNATHEIREAYSNHVYESNEINAESFERSYSLKDQVIRPLELAVVQDGNVKLATDENGIVDTTGQRVAISLTNTKTKGSVYEASNLNTPISIQATLDAGGKTNILLDPSYAVGLNVFVAIQETSKFVGKEFSTKELPILENGFDARVNVPEACNAFYSNGGLNFFKESATCGNTGLISDVVRHEWGHGLDEALGPNSFTTNGKSGITDAAYSEGIGDILSGYMAKSPNLAPGFFLNTTKPMRVMDNTRTHPPLNAAEAEIHSAGLIIGGSFWDLHQNMVAIYGLDKGNEKATHLFLRHLQTSDRYLDAYQAVLRVDDDDNNPATPSPHYCSITRAFSKHNITGGEVIPEGCIDTDTSVHVKVEFDKGDGQLSVVASAFGASKIMACPGKVTSCEADTAGSVEFAATETDSELNLKGTRIYYSAKGTIDAKTNATYTFVSADANGKALARRILDFKGL